MNHFENLLHYFWQYKLFNRNELVTTSGQKVEVLSIGQHNLDQGPDFLNAKIRIGEVLWAGNVEMHLRSSDWIRHGHNTDPVFNTVVLHVVEEHEDGVEVQLENGQVLPELVLNIPNELKDGYEELIRTTDYPRCYTCIPHLDIMMVHAWLDALLVERMNDRWHRINKILEKTHGNWHHTAFVMIARSMGAGLNGDPMELWALGYNVQGMFRHMRLRPSNYPERRIEQLTELYKSKPYLFDEILAANNLAEMSAVFTCHRNKEEGFRWGASTIRTVIINACSPLLFAYGLHTNNQDLCDRAMDILADLKGEDNYILRQWKVCHLQVDTAADSQALIQLKKQYCDHQRCLECRFGFEYLSKKKEAK